jgi:hypothetical protein
MFNADMVFITDFPYVMVDCEVTKKQDGTYEIFGYFSPEEGEEAYESEVTVIAPQAMVVLVTKFPDIEDEDEDETE